jgi:hypothetical protein
VAIFTPAQGAGRAAGSIAAVYGAVSSLERTSLSLGIPVKYVFSRLFRKKVIDRT